MPDINQYTFSHRELLEVLVKQLDLHDGKWMLLTQFNMSPGNFGPSDDELVPGMIVGIGKIGIQRADENSPPALTIDAKEVNPAAS